MEDNLKLWENIHANQVWGKYPSEQVVRSVARNFYNCVRKNIKILDFGCGAGANTWFLVREGFDVYAFDGAPSAVRKAEKYLQDEGCNSAKFKVLDGKDLDYEENFFDCVIDSACIYSNTIDNIVKMYQEVFRVLKQKGKIYSSCFGVKTDGYLSGEELEVNTYNNIKEGALANRGIAHFYTEQEFYTILYDIGFRDIVIDKMEYTDNGNKVEILMAKAVKE